MSRPGEFNTPAPRVAAFALVALLVAASGTADEIRKWRDAEGNLHVSVTGSPGGASEPSDDAPILHGRDASPEEKFSIESSLHRREIEKKLTEAGRRLEATRAELRDAEQKSFNAWVPAVTNNSRSAQASLDAQRDAFLASLQFDQEKSDSLRRLRHRERDQLKEIRGLWKEFADLDAKVTEHYGKAPPWWRGRLDCHGCPNVAEVEESLHKPRPAPSPATEKKEAGGKAEDEDDEEGWEKAWD